MDPRRWLPYLISCLTDFTAFLVVFTVSRELAETDASLLRMGLIGAVGAVVASVSNFFFGRLADRFGRRRMVVGGALLLIATPGVVYYLHWYYVAYALSGIATGMIFPSVVALLSHGRGPGNGVGGISRTLILFCLSWNVGLMSSQALGGWLFTVDMQWPLLAACCLGTADLIAASFLRKPRSEPVAAESPAALERRTNGRSMSAAFVRLAWVANLGGAFSIAMIFHLFPKLAVEMDVPADQHGFMIAMMRLFIIGVYLLMHWFSFWHFRFRLAILSQALAVAGLLLLAGATDVWHLWLGLAALGQSTGFNYFASLYYSTTGSSDARRASASGIHEATLAIGLAAGSGVGGLIGELAGVRWSYMLGAAVIVLMVGTQVAVYLRHTRSHVRLAADRP